MPKPKLTLKQVADAMGTRMAGPDADARVVAVLRAVSAAVEGYDDPAAELRQLAAAVREGGERVAADPEVVTAEVFGRVAMLLDDLAATF